MKSIIRILKTVGIVLLLFLIFFILALAIPIYCDYYTREKVLEAEVKSNIHTIQIALEKYGVKYGEYPAYLLGGDKKGWDYYNAHRPEGAPLLSDPLIESGFLDSYPENPFIRSSSWRGRKEFRKKVRAKDNEAFDPRFGLNGNKMGNVLLEPFIFVEQRDEMLKDYPRMCPGQFYYGAYGASESYEGAGGIENGNPDDFKPGSYMFFMLGGFGAIDNTGHDTIRWKDMDGTLPPKFPYISQEFCYLSADGTETEIHLRLPEIVGGLDERTPPTWPPLDDNSYLIIGAADGFRDGVIIEVWGSRQEMETLQN